MRKKTHKTSGKKRREKILIRFSNKTSYIILTIVILILAGVAVYGLTPGVAPSPGHTFLEVAPPYPCNENQLLMYTPNGVEDWTCVDFPQICPNGLWNSSGSSNIYYNLGKVWIGDVSQGIFKLGVEGIVSATKGVVVGDTGIVCDSSTKGMLSYVSNECDITSDGAYHSYLKICMQTADGVYEWIKINEHIYGSCVCTPATCTSLGYNCENWDDGCGGTTGNCGTCAIGEYCDAGICKVDYTRPIG